MQGSVYLWKKGARFCLILLLSKVGCKIICKEIHKIICQEMFNESILESEKANIFAHTKESVKQLHEQKKTQRTNGPVNAHLISWPSKAENIHNLEKYMVKK